MVNGSARPAFGAALRALRLHLGVSLNELARRAAIDPAYVHRIETRSADQPTIPRRPVVLRLGQALRLSPVQLDDLLSRAGYTPEALVALGGWDETLADVARVLAEPGLSLTARAEFREVVHILARRWLADA
ncbi:MAG: helix-turn-helix domain-containing protein [Chloroflexi bacterium]|nr:helix-turn-helix domain-containing protein [Chloroflexota bacterium]